MPNLKPYYDAALKADTEVKRILAEMDAFFTDGTEEGKQKALQLRPALDEAQAQAKEANEMYVSVRDASLTNDSMGSLFTSPSDITETDRPDQSPKSMKRSEFDRSDAATRAKFIKAGGKVVDDD